MHAERTMHVEGEVTAVCCMIADIWNYDQPFIKALLHYWQCKKCFVQLGSEPNHCTTNFKPWVVAWNVTLYNFVKHCLCNAWKVMQHYCNHKNLILLHRMLAAVKIQIPFRETECYNMLFIDQLVWQQNSVTLVAKHKTITVLKLG